MGKTEKRKGDWVKKNNIFVGYELKTGEEVNIKPAHLVVTGITAESGKTTTLQALIKRGNFKAIIFKTKIGEKGIIEGNIVPAYYKDQFDWEYASELLESSRKEKLKFERSWIIKYSKTANNLVEFKNNIDEALSGKLRELEKSVLITLQAYLEKILPELQYAALSNTLELHNGINIMDLERFKDETQGLIIRSVLTEVLKSYKNTIVVIPESWKFLPERLGNPVKRPAEAFIRQGATNNNFLWIDSQDVTGISKTILKQVSNWFLGYQREVNEIKRTLDQIPLPKKKKPKPEEIASLQVGHFFVATSQFTKRVYVQPIWLDGKTAKKVALGNVKVDDLEAPQPLTPYSIQPQTQPEIQQEPLKLDLSPVKKELTELRHDFFNKIQEQQEAISKVYTELYALKNQPKQEVNTDEIVGLVLQKIPSSNGGGFNKEELINDILSRVPKTVGAATYEVAPLEKLRKDFLEEAKNKVLGDIEKLSDNAKRLLKYIEAKGQGAKSLELEEKCFFMNHGGASVKKVSEASIALRSIGVAKKDSAGWHKGTLKERIKEYLGNHKATEQETEQVYNHIIMTMLGGSE